MLQFMREQTHFRYLWLADFVSQLGTQVSFLGIPLIAVTVLDVSSFEVSVLVAVGWLPVAMLSLPAGAYVDRVDRRPLMIVCSMARCFLLLLVPIGYYFGVLSIWLLYVVTYLVGSFTILFGIAQRSYVPSNVARAGLVRGNSLLEMDGAITRVGGPAFAGLLIAVLTAPIAILLDSLSYVVSSVFLFKVGADKDPKDEMISRDTTRNRPSFVFDVREGVRYVLHHKLLFQLLCASALTNFGSSIMEGIFIVYAVRELGISAGAIGAIYALANTGLFLGATTSVSMSEKLGLGRTLVAATALQILGLFLLPMAYVAPFFLLSAGLVFRTIGVVIYNVNQRSLRQAIVPTLLQGRVSATVGSLAGGRYQLVRCLVGFWCPEQALPCRCG